MVGCGSWALVGSTPRFISRFETRDSNNPLFWNFSYDPFTTTDAITENLRLGFANV